MGDRMVEIPQNPLLGLSGLEFGRSPTCSGAASSCRAMASYKMRRERVAPVTRAVAAAGTSRTCVRSAPHPMAQHVRVQLAGQSGFWALRIPAMEQQAT